ncbi:MAG: RNA polymerase sigma factor [Gaiellaceae bacterium]
MEASRVRKPLRLLKSPDRSFEQLYRTHAREVYQYALALLANPADAEDVTQTTFLNAYRAFQRGERPHKPHNWLIAIAHNVCRMRWRQAGSRPREVALDLAPEPAVLENGHADLDEVLAALAVLTFNQRAAIVMRELEGRTYQEISEVLGVSVSAVEALLFRARRRLQVNRKALGLLTTVPLPGSLGSFVGAGGGGAAAVGGSLVVKAGTILAVGTAAAGLGLKGVEAVGPKAPPAQASARPAAAAATKHAATANRRTTPQRAKVKPRSRNAVATSSRAERPQVPSNASAPPPPPPATAGAAPSAPAPTLVKPPSLPTVKPPAPPTLPPPPEVKLPPLPPPLPPLPPVKLPQLPPLPPLNTP